jgi:Uri superfamily endonuclease
MVKGVYCLIINLTRNKTIKIGKLGSINFKKGYYCYVGSALNNLEKRIQRHKSKKKKFHWHIDYFLKYGKIIDVIKIETTKKIECSLSKKINNFADDRIKNFGCSDCRCKSHLYFFNQKPNLPAFKK